MTLPLVLAGIVHMIIVKLDALSYLKIPLHETWFGLNKTWRGVVVMPLLTVAGLWISFFLANSWQSSLFGTHTVWGLGILLGFGYVIPELPNSFIKRRMGVKPGEMSERSPWVFSLFDQADSVIGCVLVYALCGVGNLSLWVTLFLLGTGIHLLLNVLLWSLGLRKNPL
jgi:CDP-diacylglycerol--serine O-phosphatidyltransferase